MYIEASFIDISTLDMKCIMDLIIISKFDKISRGVLKDVPISFLNAITLGPNVIRYRNSTRGFDA